MASLQVLKGLPHEPHIPLDRDRLLLGRGSECDVVLPDGPVSRRHAQIVRVQDKFYIEDLKSRNNTYVNDQKVIGRAPLEDHDRIRICDFIAVFSATDEDSSSV